MMRVVLLCALALLAHTAAGVTESKTFTIDTKDGPMTVTETKVTEVTEDKSGDSGSSVGMSEAGGTMVLAVDKSAISKGVETFISNAIKKLPMATKGMKVGFVVYTDTASTLVSLKEGWSLDQVMARLQREIAAGAKYSGKVLDYIGLQAAYNELKAHGKETAPRIVLLLSSGKDADKAKTAEWRKKLMSEWISMSEVHISSSSSGSFVEVREEETSSAKPPPVSTLLATLMKSYSLTAIQDYKEIYGEMWEFYIVLKYYKRMYPTTWRSYIEAWYKTKYGNLEKFNIYLYRINGKLEWYQRKYGANWRWYYKRYLYSRRYGVAWRLHFDNWVKIVWKKPAPALPAFILRRITYYKKKFGVNWEWFYKRYVYRRRFGLRWRVHFDRWVKTTWKKPAPALPAFILRRLNLFKSRFGANWHYFYSRALYRRLYGRRWRTYFSKWVKLVWKKPVPAHLSLIRRSIAWFKERHGANWEWFYTRILYRRRYGYRWRFYFSRWVRTVWKKPTPVRRYYVIYRRAGGPWQVRP